MSKAIIFSLIIFGVIFMVNNVIANSETSKQSYPPGQYQLEDISISVLNQTGHRLPGNYKINIGGGGKAIQAIDQKEKIELILPEETRVEILNDFYRIHFFELKDTYTINRHVALLDDNLISTFSNRLIDMGSQRLCIEIVDYKKCVTIMDGRPFEASQLVKKIETLFTETSSEK